MKGLQRRESGRVLGSVRLCRPLVCASIASDLACLTSLAHYSPVAKVVSQPPGLNPPDHLYTVREARRIFLAIPNPETLTRLVSVTTASINLLVGARPAPDFCHLRRPPSDSSRHRHGLDGH
jgi:hypothetical protein